jgi:hypothetical protein
MRRIYSNPDPHGVAEEEIINKNLQNQHANFDQTWYKSSLREGNSELFNVKL